jgi:nucleoid-associated protein YgaU
MKYTAIFEANKDVLSNPDVVDPGQELIIPNL